jgi:hypothetical protein
MVAWRTSTYNTGWMNGAIKLATLSDTDTANVTGANLLTGDNSTFTGGIGDWYDNSYSSTLTNANGALTMNASSGYQQAVVTVSNLVVGKTYVWSWDQIAQTSGNFRSFIGSAILTVPQNATGGFSMTFVATATSQLIKYKRTASSGNCQVDNIVVRLAVEDRSVNGNGLQVFGTVTKTAVATGADLVAYSGFSSSNYLEQPYNSGLDFGTGDFSYMTWFKMDNTSSASELFGRSDGATYSIRVLVRPGNPDIKFQIASTTNIATSYTYPHSVWNHICVVRKNGVAYVYVNAERLTLNTDANGGDVDAAGADAYSRIGVNPNDAQNPTQGNIALTRISATAPSPEQIAKIYNDEKHLFQAGAQATLYGTSDAVTALAHDDTTDLLHVGTSAGRSVFQGLRRVDNTTDAITAAISASNNLVVEE